MSIYTSVLKFCISAMPLAKTNTLSNCKCFPKFGSFAIYQDPLFILHSFYAFFYQFFQANSSNFAPSGRGLPRMLAWRRKSGAVRKWSTFNAIRWKCSLLWKFHLFVVWLFDYNGNRTEGVRRVINKIDLSITSMITDRVGRHGVLLPINHNRYNFREKIHLGQTSPAGTMSKITFLYFRKKTQFFFQNKWLLLWLFWSILWLVDRVEWT